MLGPDDGAAGLDRHPGDARVVAVADRLELATDDVGHLLRQRGHRERGVLRGVGDAVAAAEVDLGAVVAVLVDDPGVQARPGGGPPSRSRRCRRSGCRCGCAARAGRTRRAGPAARVAASNAWPPARLKPNFWSSWPVAMNSWVCASTPTVTRTMTGATTPSSAATVGDPVDLVERVDDDPPDPVGQRLADLGGGLVVAVEADPLRRGSRPAARPRARRRCTRRGAGPPRRPSARPRCRGTPCPRSRRRHRPARRRPTANPSRNSPARERKSSSSRT